MAVLAGLLCHGLFIAGVAMMIWQMHGGMAGTFGRLPPPWSIAANGLMLMQFPLGHTALLTRPGQALLRRLAPPGMGGTLLPTSYVAVAAAQTLLLFSLWTPSGIVWWQAGGFTRMLLEAAYGASWLLLGKAIFDAGLGLQTGFIGWGAVFTGGKPAYPPMPTGGLFRFSRQPIYFAFTLTVWTVPVWTPDQLAIALVLSAYCVAGPLHKEMRFRQIFGADFAAYQQGHSYFLPWTARQTVANDLTIYDRFAEHWWDGSVRWLRTLQNLVPARLGYFGTLTPWRGLTVLDVGCGGGFMSEAMAGRGAMVTGIDPAAAAIRIAADHAAETGSGIRYLVAGGEAIPLPDASTDIVVCVDVLEHVNDLNKVINEIARVLKPGGLFLFDTINRTLLARLVIVDAAERLLRLLPRGTHDPAKFITPDELRGHLRAAGFDAPSFTGLGPTGLNRRLDFTFGRLPVTGIQYMGHARRL